MQDIAFGSSASEDSGMDGDRSPRGTKYKSALIRRFDFSSALQRMSVVCKNQVDNKFKAFVKGSPEMISSLCHRQTLPIDFDEVLMRYTKEGYRVIALAVKELPGLTYRNVQTIARD